jgi:hypothetical protein
VVNIRHGVMVSNWNSGPVWWTGIAATVVQSVLTILSLLLFRNRFYETFKT